MVRSISPLLLFGEFSCSVSVPGSDQRIWWCWGEFPTLVVSFYLFSRQSPVEIFFSSLPIRGGTLYFKTFSCVLCIIFIKGGRGSLVDVSSFKLLFFLLS